MSEYYEGFQINTEDSTRPWGGVEEQAWRDIIDTAVGDSDTGLKNTAGHGHWRLKDNTSQNDQIRVHEDYVVIPSIAGDTTTEYVMCQTDGRLVKSGHVLIDEYTGLTDTPSDHTANCIPFVNPAGTAHVYNSNFQYQSGTRKLIVDDGFKLQGASGFYTINVTTDALNTDASTYNRLQIGGNTVVQAAASTITLYQDTTVANGKYLGITSLKDSSASTGTNGQVLMTDGTRVSWSSDDSLWRLDNTSGSLYTIATRSPSAGLVIGQKDKLLESIALSPGSIYAWGDTTSTTAISVRNDIGTAAVYAHAGASGSVRMEAYDHTSSIITEESNLRLISNSSSGYQKIDFTISEPATGDTDRSSIQIWVPEPLTAQNDAFLGIGRTDATPYNWTGNFSGLEIGGRGTVSHKTQNNSVGELILAENAYYDGANFAAIKTGAASWFTIADGRGGYYRAPLATQDTALDGSSVWEWTTAFGEDRLSINYNNVDQDFEVRGMTNNSLIYADASKNTIGVGVAPSTMLLALGFDYETIHFYDSTDFSTATGSGGYTENPVALQDPVKMIKIRAGSGSQVYYIMAWDKTASA